MTASPCLTIVIVTYNSGPDLSVCLTALPAALAGVSAEILIVDNASISFDGGAPLSVFPDAQIIANTENIGFARAVNQGIARAAGRYALLLNPDTVPAPGLLAALCDVLESRPDAAAVSPLLLNADGSPQFCWARFQNAVSEWTGRDDRSQSPYPLADFAYPERRTRMAPFPADWVGGACLLLRKSVIDRIGPLDAGFFLYGEEEEWCSRAKRAGMTILLTPQVAALHRGSGPGLTGTRRRYLFQSRLRLYRRLYGPLGGLPAMAIAAARYGLNLLRRKPPKKN